MPEEKKFQLPGGSWETLKKIIRAFNAAQGQANPTVESVAKLAGVPRPAVSANNNFLRSVGLLQADQWRLTEAGTRFAAGIGLGNKPLARDALQEIVKGNETLRQLAGIVQARGPMELGRFRAEAILLFGLNENSRQLPFVKAIIDLLQESEVISATDGEVSFCGYFVGDVRGVAAEEPSSHMTARNSPTKDEGAVSGERRDITKMPLPLGPGRLAYIELPSDWKKEELSKLIKLLEISLGDTAGSTKDG